MREDLLKILIEEAEKIGLRTVNWYDHYESLKDEKFFTVIDIRKSWEIRTKGYDFYFKDQDCNNYSLDFLIKNRVIL